MDIETRTLRALEWDRLREYLSEEALTAWGRELCLALTPQRQSDVVELLSAETVEATALVRARSGLSQEGLPDLREAVDRLKAGAELSGPELTSVRLVLTASRQARSTLSLIDRGDFPRLTGFLPRLHTLPELVAAIDNAVDETGLVKDSASPLLTSLRRELQAAEGQIKEELLRIIHSATLGKALQEPLYTQRNGRYVLPVVSGQRSTIPGIVHDSSASGLTVYVEPMPVVELSNRSRLKMSEIDREIARILMELSGDAALHVEEIDAAFRALIDLDLIMSRARFGLRYQGVAPEISADGTTRLKAARHPLLILQDPAGASAIVANDIALGGDARTMVVTGPNTGGKTVLLKTTGLLALMARAGLPLPVAPGSRVALFAEVYADIGDEQSLTQSLSTFSSHMTNIIEVVDRSGPDCLILLDEIGAGTDPREGAALARAILETLNETGASTITTTHYGELKTLAYTQSGFINASLEFDEVTLSPTYRLRVGIPGSSKATTIARRLGLSQTVVARADTLIAEGPENVQRVIERLEQKLEELAVEKREAADAAARAKDSESAALAQLQEIDREREKVRSGYSREIEEELKLAREYVRGLIADLQRQPTSKRAQEAQKEIEKIRSELKWLTPEEHRAHAGTLSVGQRVRVLSLNQVGVIESLPPPSEKGEDRATVTVGALTVKVPVADLSPVAQAGGPAASKPSQGKRESERSGHRAQAPDVFVRTAGNTLDLRGLRVDAALQELTRFIDEAAVDGVASLMIIHGHGTGRVKSAVREYLESCPYEIAFRPGEPYEGGDGVTIVSF